MSTSTDLGHVVPEGTEDSDAGSLSGLIRKVHFPERPNTQAEALWASGIVLGYLAIAFWLTGWLLPRLLRTMPDFNVYVAQPILWTGLAVLSYAAWRRLPDVPAFSRTLTGIAFFVGMFHVAVLAVAGLIFGLGESPTAGRLVNYPKNLLYLVTLLAGMELARGVLYTTWHRSRPRLAFLATTLILLVVSIPPVQWTLVDDADGFLRLAGGSWLPTLAISALATWLVMLGGIGPSFGYRLALVSFEWFSPVLADLEWPVLLLIGTLTPVAAAGLIRGIYAETNEGANRLAELYEEPVVDPSRRRHTWQWAGLAASAAVAAAVVVVASGAIGFRAYVVDGVSMEPAYQAGDVVVVQDVDPSDLQPGDVIQFQRNGRAIVHRIVDVRSSADDPVFITQGDNVPLPDRPVPAADVDGRVIWRLPEIGNLKLWLAGS